MSNQKHEDIPITISFISGGIAGAVSRTVVSPFERVKILKQVEIKNDGMSNSANISTLIKRMYQNEGIKGLFRGNGMNCIRVFPYMAVQYLTFETFKNYILNYENARNTKDGSTVISQLTNVQRLVDGALSGGLSCLVTYPLDLVKTRLSIQTTLNNKNEINKLKHPGMVELLTNTYKNEGGIRGLYKGLFPTLLGIVPYVALNFQIYEDLKELYLNHYHINEPSSFIKLTMGAVSGGIAQCIIYPFDLLRRRFQVISMNNGSLGIHYTGVVDALLQIGKKEGFKGYYKGLTANLFKVVPSTAVQWLTYELCVEYFFLKQDALRAF
ncbi:related to mitochondrial carrier protein [Saccharomycodes ludwigii]|uniref:Related to mitochondrial carrier protein n=1 Tax=Saccharomycodes ludwigii TaxID=36035 RepID=A0A376B1I4_9ASCO|nr:hypothetical protein SCDLUD_001435 [Saccharomycodes ludwigii]KAH3901665.1 hypothetical protein SCDLUD_001435 [Saccharomycodes ludwigii]SSD58556.1 related to mitochondrial carrier protein [Saccharomycodes ludwigii]